MNTSNNFGFTPIQSNKQINPEAVEERPSEREFGFQPIKKSEVQQQEGFVDRSIRQATGTMTRALESFLGSAGEFSELANSITEPLAQYLVPLNKEQKEKKSQLSKLPTTKNLREITKRVTGEYLEPKGKKEQALHEGGELLGSIIGPMSFRKALGVAVGSQLAKEGLKLSGASPTTQEASKFGTMLTLSMVNPNGVKKFWTDLYSKRATLTPPGTIVDGKKLATDTRDLIHEIKKGTLASSEVKVLEQAEKVLEKVQPSTLGKKGNIRANPRAGQVDLNEMIAVKRSLNEVAGDPEVWKRGQHQFGKLQQAINDVLSLHPDKEAVKLGKMADEAFGGFHESQKVSRFIKSIVGEKPLKSVALSAGIEALSGHPEAIIPTIVGATAGAGLVKGYELLTRINANPTLRKYYLDLLVHASKGSSVAAQKSLRKLDEEMDKQDKSKVRNK